MRGNPSSTSFLEGEAVAYLRANWITLSLLALVVIISMSSIHEARWLDDSSPLLRLLLTGMLFGWLVSQLRWPGWFAGLYAMLLSVLISLQIIGHVFPSPATLLSQSVAESGWGIRVRTLNLFERMGGWAASLNRGENITDTRLFVLAFGVLAWAVTVWLVWNVLRREHTLEGLLPLGLLVGINTYLSDQDTLYLWMYILFALLLVARSAWTTLHADWDARGVDYPEDLSEWAFGAVVGSLLVAGVVYTLPVVGTREGWDLISEWTRPLREQTAQTTERLFADVNPAQVEVFALHMITPDLTTIGRPIATGTETVLYVSVSDPPPLPAQAGVESSTPQHYWRSEVLATYNGMGWEPATLQPAGAEPAFPAKVPDGRYPLEQTFELTGAHDQRLFASNEPVMTTGAEARLRYTQPDDSALVSGSANQYKVTSYANQVSAGQLRSDAKPVPAEILQAYTQLPNSLPERVRNMAERVMGRADNDYDRAVALQTYLRETYPYNLKVSTPPPGRDAVDYFLYEAQEGFCSYYASAMTVMLRSQGVPSRVVIGYATGEYDFSRRAYRVPLSAAHAWVEVYFPSYGWVEFEPTPALTVFNYPESELPAHAASQDIPEPQPAQTLFTNPLALAAGGLLLLVLLALAGVRLHSAWRFRKEMRLPANQAAGLYWEMRGWLAGVGMRAGASSTPAEFLAAYSPALTGRARLLKAVLLVTALYQQSSYSPSAPLLEEVSQGRQAWRQSAGERLRLQAGALWRRLKRVLVLKQRKKIA